VFGTITQAPVERGSHIVYKTNAVKWELLSKLFVKFTMLVPSSAAVERFFSQDKNILKAKKASLADKTFEMPMFMRGNKHHFLVLTVVIKKRIL
jgi:hypothetical protein